MTLPEFKLPENRATFARGEVPLMGWFLIEPPFRHASPRAKELLHALELPEDSPCPDEAANISDLHEIAANYAQGDQEGRGILLTADHSGEGIMPSTRACGWIRALEVDTAGMWACIDWTPYGHDMVNAGEYAFFSTEYNYSDFYLTKGYAAPRVLAACSLTNQPRHAGQQHATNTKTTTSQMNPDKKDKAQNESEDKDKAKASQNPPKEDAKKVASNTPDKKEEDKARNSDREEDDKATNSDSEDSISEIEELLTEIAELLELPEDSTAENLIQAVESLISSNAELRDALDAANADADSSTGSTARVTNSRRFPRLLRASNSRLRGQKPNGTVQVVIGRARRAVNSQQNDMVGYINGRIESEESRLGRRLNAGEYTRSYKAAMQAYKLEH